MRRLVMIPCTPQFSSVKIHSDTARSVTESVMWPPQACQSFAAEFFPNSSAELVDLCHEDLVRTQYTYRWVFVLGVSFWNVCPLTSEGSVHSASRCGHVRRSRRPLLSGTTQSRVFTMRDHTYVNVMMDMTPGTTSWLKCHTQSIVWRHPILQHHRSYVFFFFEKEKTNTSVSEH